jgi:hypothetical protein
MKPREFLQVDPATLRLPREAVTPSETRLELLKALAELSRLQADWRFGQMIANLAMTAGRVEPGAVWDLEDAEALAAARTLIEQTNRFEAAVA